MVLNYAEPMAFFLILEVVIIIIKHHTAKRRRTKISEISSFDAFQSSRAESVWSVLDTTMSALKQMKASWQCQ
jgi:hypothetical protein